MFRLFVVIVSIVVPMTSALLAQTGHVAGTVRDVSSEEPLPGANIIIDGSRTGASADSVGRFVIRDVSPGTYQLRVSFVGYESVNLSVVISAGQTTDVSVLLHAEHLESELIVVTGTRTLRSVADVPVRVEAIPEEEVEEKLLMTPSSVAMLLNESTGMRVQTTSASASTANLRIQGLSGRYTQVLHDDIPSFGGLSAGLSLMQLVPLDLKQVEVLKGATSSLYGADAIAGVVNFIPKLPGKSVETSLLMNATTQHGFDAAGYTSHQIGRTGASVMVSHNRQPLFDVDGDGFADVAQFTRTTVTPRVLHRFSDTFSSRVSFSMLHEDRIGGATKAGLSRIGYTESITTQRFDISSHTDWKVAEGKDLSVKLAWLRSERDASFGGSPFSAIQHVSFVDAQYTFDLSGHALLLGAAYRSDQFADRTAGAADRSYRFSVPSLLVQDEFRVTNDLTVLLGGRIDQHDTFGTFVVPRMSVMYKPSAVLTLRAGGGTGYKAPTIFVEEAEEVGFRGVQPLTGVRPEKARSGSFDVNWRSIIGSITADINTAFFLTMLDDAVLADDDSLANGVVSLRNASGPTRSAGGEISARFTYDDVKVLMGYTYVYATQEDRSRVSELELTPRHAFGIVLFWEPHRYHLKVGFENYWTGTQRIARHPFRTSAPAHWITGFIAEKAFGNFRVFINFENIFDTRQTRNEAVYVGSVGSGTFRTLPVYAPLEGRVINGGVRYVLGSPDGR